MATIFFEGDLKKRRAQTVLLKNLFKSLGEEPATFSNEDIDEQIQSFIKPYPKLFARMAYLNEFLSEKSKGAKLEDLILVEDGPISSALQLVPHIPLLQAQKIARIVAARHKPHLTVYFHDAHAALDIQHVYEQFITQDQERWLVLDSKREDADLREAILADLERRKLLKFFSSKSL